MSYSNKTQRELDKYASKMIKRFPRWIRELFQDGKAFITVDEDGALAVGTVALGKQRCEAILKRVEEYVAENPSPAIGSMLVQ